MASKRRLRRKACERKASYSKDDAFGLATKLRNTVAAGQAVKPEAYPCAYCNGWHVGRPPKKVQIAHSARRRERRRQA